MLRSLRSRLTVFPCAACLMFASVAWLPAQNTPFVQRSGATFMLNGAPFRFGGTNILTLMWQLPDGADQLLGTAAADDMQVVRMWLFFETTAPNDWFYLQYWDPTAGAPAYNDGSDGLARMDYDLYRASQLHIKLIVTLANNWPDFGGMDKYVEWRGLQYHDQFFTDATIRQWYKNWISHVLNRVNTLTGVAYKDDPTIMAWELANEPQCRDDSMPRSPSGCTNQTMIDWITDSAAYIRSIDQNHLIGTGDDGSFCNPGSPDLFDNCSAGVDSLGFSSVANIDMVGLHLYPDLCGRGIAWADSYIDEHAQEAATLGKPFYMGEFGLLSGDGKVAAFSEWTKRFFSDGGNGATAFGLDPGTPPVAQSEEPIGWVVEAGSPVLSVISNFAQTMAAGSMPTLPPVAGNWFAATPFGEPATLNVLANDAAWGNNVTIDPDSIDLDPATPGRETSAVANGGVFNVVGQTVEFTPTTGFSGTVSQTYTVEDSNHQKSIIGYVTVTVNAPQALLESFETGTDGWRALTPENATFAQSTLYRTEGAHSLEVNVTKPDWVGFDFPAPINLSNADSLQIDVTSPQVGGGSSGIAFQTGSSWLWCQNVSVDQPLPLLGTATITVQLKPSAVSCGGNSPDFTSVRSAWVWFSNPGTYYLDNLRWAPAPVAAVGALAAQAASLAGAASTGSVQISAPDDTSWTAISLADWITITSGASGTGNGAVTFSVAANSGPARTGYIMIGGQVFAVEQESAASSALPLVGSMAQIASAGGWDTTLMLVNLAPSQGEASLNFFDNGGNTPWLPFTFPQQPVLGVTLGGTWDASLAANAMLIFDTDPSSQTPFVGSAQLLANGDINGFAVFTYIPSGQSATVPLETRNADSYLLAFDNTGQVATGVAIANLAAVAADVRVVVRNDTGARIATGAIHLAAEGHNSFMLTDGTYGFPATIGIRGTVEFDTPSNGRISVVGLRANVIPNGSGFAITTLPMLAQVGTSGGAMAHFASGGGWQTTFTLVNTGTTAATATLNFYGSDGKAASRPLNFPQTGLSNTSDSAGANLSGGSSLVVVVEDQGSTTAGSAVLTTNGNVGGFAVFRYNPTGQEAVVPLQAANASSYILAFDNTGNLATGLAIANIATEPANINVVIRDDRGTQIGAGSVSLPAQGHTSFMLTDTASGGWAVTAGVRGTIEFDTPLGGRIAPLGLRAATIPGGFTITTIPVMLR